MHNARQSVRDVDELWCNHSIGSDWQSMFEYTEKKLAKEIKRVAESIDSSLRCTYLSETQQMELTRDDDNEGGPYLLFLGNVFLKVSEMPKKERLASLEAFIRDVLTPKELSPEEFMASLALRVRTEFEVDYRNRHITLMGHEAPPSVSVRRGELLVEIVSDSNESVSVARSDDLAEIGVTEEEAFRMAAARIRRGTDEDQWEKVAQAIWISSYQDDYDFSRLVAAEDFGKFPFGGSPIVFAPSHSICLATDNTSAEVLSRMVEIGNEYSASHRPFCQLLWTLEDRGEWKVWQPEQHSEASGVADLQSARETSKKYEETKDYLERALNEDVFVATYKAIRNDDGLTSYCVYTLDLPSYLPHTSFVAIVDPERPEGETVVGRVDWQQFEECLGDASLEKIEDMNNPAWHRTIQSLSRNQKDRLFEVARPLN